MKNKGLPIIPVVIAACIAMAYIESFMQPVYIVKSVLKIAIFMGGIVLCGVNPLEWFVRAPKRELYIALGLGAAVIATVLGGFAILDGFIDFSGVTTGLGAKEGINASNFPLAALYIIFINSLLEELFFRGLAWLELKKYTNEYLALGFSSLLFALYHIGIMGSWVSVPLTALATLALFCAGGVFCLLDRRGSLIPSQLLHMSANIAINTVALRLFGII